MRGAFYVATAILIASSIRTAAESVQIKSDITQYHDKLPVSDSDTKTLPRRSLRGSGDQLESPVAEEERVNSLGVLKDVEKDVSKVILRLDESKMKSVSGLNNMVSVGEHVGSSGTKNYEDAVAKFQQVKVDYKNAIKKLKALELRSAEATKQKRNNRILNEQHSAQANAWSQKAHFYRIDFVNHDNEVDNAANIAIDAKTKLDQLLAEAEKVKQLVNVFYLAGRTDAVQDIQVYQADLLNAAATANKDFESALVTAILHHFARDNIHQFIITATQAEKMHRDYAELYKNAANEALKKSKMYKTEVEQAARAVSTAKSKLGAAVSTAKTKPGAQAEKIAFVPPEFEAAKAGKRSKLDLNVKATLAEKRTHATQGQAASPAHFAIDSHDIPATEELELTLSLPNPTNQGTKLKRKRKQDQLDDNREGGSRIVNDLHPAIAQPARNTFPDVNYDPIVSKGKQTL
ncbi:hypothetical protein Plhal710r2_c053g0160291 [Plasmopara halstedii]